jgi:DNA-binding LacI/PurR family transcriptional regulator
MMNRRPTMAEVARAAGVSVMTVSYAYGQPERVSEQARRRVREAAERLGYPGPHPVARSLRWGRASALGVILGERLTYAFDDPQAARFLAGVAEVCLEHGLALTILPVTGAPADAARVAEAAVDGFVVWTTADDDPVVDAIAATGIPAAIHGGPEREGMPLVAADDRAAARAVAAEAFAGARRPAVVSFPLDRSRTAAIVPGPDPDAATFRVTRLRLAGFRDAWHDLAGTWQDVQVAVCARNSSVEAEDTALALLSAPDPPDAVAAMSDELAVGVLRAAARLGLSLAVTGWDDSDAAASAGLTTIAQSLRDQGTRCARLALGEPAAGEVEWSLVRRSSTVIDPPTHHS